MYERQAYIRGSHRIAWTVEAAIEAVEPSYMRRYVTMSEHVVPECSIKRLVAPATAAKMLDVSRQSVMRLVQRGELEAVRIGALWRVKKDSLIRLIDGDAGDGEADV